MMYRCFMSQPAPAKKSEPAPEAQSDEPDSEKKTAKLINLSGEFFIHVCWKKNKLSEKFWHIMSKNSTKIIKQVDMYKSL